MTSADPILHPRPRLTRERWVDLNGQWQFAYDDARCAASPSAGRRMRAVSTATITVPFPPESEMSGIGDTGFHPVLWYRRSFAAHAPTGRAAAAAFRRRRLSRRGLGQWRSRRHATRAATPRSRADITASLDASGEQIVVVRAEDQPDATSRSRAASRTGRRSRTPSGTTAPPASGRRCGSSRSPETYIDELQLTPDLATGSVKVEAASQPALSPARSHVRLHKGGKILAEQRGAGRRQRRRNRRPHPGRAEWRPPRRSLLDARQSQPHRGHRDRCSASDGSAVDALESYFGLRSVGIGNGRFLLNDRPMFVRSVLEQGYLAEIAPRGAESPRRCGRKSS